MKVYLEKDLIHDIAQLANRMSTQKALADKIGVSQAYLTNVIKGRRRPSAKILKFLGYERIVCYKEVK